MQGKIVKVLRELNKYPNSNSYFAKDELAIVTNWAPSKSGFNCRVTSLDGTRSTVGNLRVKREPRDCYHFILIGGAAEVLYG